MGYPLKRRYRPRALLTVAWKARAAHTHARSVNRALTVAWEARVAHTQRGQGSVVLVAAKPWQIRLPAARAVESRHGAGEQHVRIGC